MNKIKSKYIYILLYIIIFISIGYYSVETDKINTLEGLTRENISWISLFMFNYSNVMFLILISFIGGILSIFAVTNLLIKTGIALHIICFNTKISIFSIVSITMIHGIFGVFSISNCTRNFFRYVFVVI